MAESIYCFPTIVPERTRFPILLVEDNEIDANIFESALKQVSPRLALYWVASAKEGLEFLRQEGRFREVGPPELVILDLHLADGEDGFEALRQIKSDPDLCRKPVIMLTSSIAADDIDLAYSLGANAYFRKPMTLQAYVEQVATIVHHWLELAQLPSNVSPRSSQSFLRSRSIAEEPGI